MNGRTIGLTYLMLILLSARVTAQDTTGSVKKATTPLIQGTLWVLPSSCAEWNRWQFEAAIRAQRAVGFKLLWLLNTPSFTPTGDKLDVVDTICSIADAEGMQVIVDLPQGGWYGKASAEDVIAKVTQAAREVHQRYGGHDSFYGWYLNYEINPIRPDDVEETAYWRHVWQAIADQCHRLAPGSLVTISPFFLLDDMRRRGFVYLTPEQYAKWWHDTLKETRIDVLMLQDSGEHLAFFTLEQREPFWRAVAKATRDAGAKFWLNVETGEADVTNWDEYLVLEAQKRVPWRFTPMPWLEQKLASRRRVQRRHRELGLLSLHGPASRRRRRGFRRHTRAGAGRLRCLQGLLPGTLISRHAEGQDRCYARRSRGCSC